MSLITRDIIHYKRIKKFTAGKEMLMLGNQVSDVGPGKELFGCSVYKTLDLDDGDYCVDLTDDLSHMFNKWEVVFNLGTIEHIWDVHKAYCNAASMVKVNGLFIGHAPVGADYVHHGINLTSPNAILKFFEINKFLILDYWFSENRLLWHVALKTGHVEKYRVPQQLWDNLEDAGIT